MKLLLEAVAAAAVVLEVAHVQAVPVQHFDFGQLLDEANHLTHRPLIHLDTNLLGLVQYFDDRLPTMRFQIQGVLSQAQNMEHLINLTTWLRRFRWPSRIIFRFRTQISALIDLVMPIVRLITISLLDLTMAITTDRNITEIYKVSINFFF